MRRFEDQLIIELREKIYELEKERDTANRQAEDSADRCMRLDASLLNTIGAAAMCERDADLYIGVKKSWCPLQIFRKFFPCTGLDDNSTIEESRAAAKDNPSAIPDAFRPICDKHWGSKLPGTPFSNCSGQFDETLDCWKWFEENISLEVLNKVRKVDKGHV